MADRLRRGQTTTAQLAAYCDEHGVRDGMEFELWPCPPDNVCARCGEPVGADGYREILGHEPLRHQRSMKGKSVSAQVRTGRRVYRDCVERLRNGLAPTQGALL
jgi:hypothetical protein